MRGKGSLPTPPAAEISAARDAGRRRRTIVGLLLTAGSVTLFCLVLLWRDPLLFWNDDYELSILPVFADVARSWSEGQIPLLSPYSWVCSNLAGEFQYGTFSAFINVAIVLIWKFPLTFPQQAAALSIVHLVVLALGGFLLARDRMLAVPLAIVVGLIGALNGWIVCWGATDWFGALGAFAWFPWAWWALERSLNARYRRLRAFLPAPFVYLVITGGFPYTVLMLVLLICWLCLRAATRARRIGVIWPIVIGSALGVGCAAPAWLALFEYVRGSAREVQQASAHFQWLVPPAALPAFVLPCWTVNWADFSNRLLPHGATEMACGVVAPAALLLGMIQHGKAFVRRMRWELGLLGCVLIISMLPSANVFRWSFRWLPFVHLALALSAAESLQNLHLRLKQHCNQPVTSNVGLFGLVLTAAAIVAMNIFGTVGRETYPFVWWMLGLATLWAVLDFAGSRSVRLWLYPALTLGTLLATYLCIAPNCGVPKYNLSQSLTAPFPLDPKRLYLSVHPPPEQTYRTTIRAGSVGDILRPGSTSMWGGVRFINGYSPIRAAGVAREFRSEIHGETPDWMSEYLLTWQAGATGELARLGVDGVVVASEIQVTPKPESEWTLMTSSKEGRVYHRAGAPFASVRAVTLLESRTLATREAAGPMTLPGRSTDLMNFAPARISAVEDRRNCVSVDVAVDAGDRPGLIAFTRPFFPGYTATIGNVRLPVESYRGLMPVVRVPAGTAGRLRLAYEPPWLLYGGALAMTCAAMIAAAAGLALVRKLRAT